MDAKELIRKKIESLQDLIRSYEDSVEFCQKTKDWILCNNYQVRIGMTVNFSNELVEILNQLEHRAE